MTKIKQIIEWFQEHPPRVKDRKATEIMLKFDCTMDEVVQARELFRSSKTESTAQSPKMEMDHNLESKTIAGKVELDQEPMSEDELYGYFKLSKDSWQISRIWGIWKNGKYNVSVFFKPREVSENLVEVIRETLANITAKPYTHVGSPVVGTDRTHYAVMCLFDAHLGRIGSMNYSGADFDLQESLEDVYLCAGSLLSRMSLNTMKKVIIPIGNDFFNVDNVQLGTTKGTPQNNTLDLKEVFKAGLEFITVVVEHIIKQTEVEIVLVPGNHDNLSSTYLAVALEKYFEKTPMVNVNSSPIDRKYILCGKTLLTFTHGELAPQRLAELIPHEAKEMFSRAKYYEALVGHYHQEKWRIQPHIETGGIVIRNLAAIANKDIWSYKEGYTLATRRAYSIIYHETYGRDQELVHNL